MAPFDSVVVFTTPERLDMFQNVFGKEADFRLDARKSAPFVDSLKNAAVAGGTIAVIDEKHFLRAQDMVEGIFEFANSNFAPRNPFRIIVVCQDRVPEDALLTHLVAFCGVLDIIYGASREEVVLKLGELLTHPNRRYDVRDLLNVAHWRGVLRDYVEPPLPDPLEQRGLKAVLLDDGSVLVRLTASARPGL